jgi:hypothetical protein
MMKRVVWFAAGAMAGVSGSAYARRKAREAAVRYRPVRMAKGAVDRVTDAVREGRKAMVAREAELRAAQPAGIRPSPGEVEPPTARQGDLRFDVPAERSRTGPRRRSRR